jgi:signal transduction histidine kinase
MAKIWSNRGIIYTRLANYKLAEFFLDKAKTFYSQNQFPKELNGLLLRLTEIYDEIGNYEASLQSGLEALSIAEANSFTVERTRALIRLSWTYFNKRNYTLCEKYVLQAIESSLNYGLALEEANAYNMYGLLLSITNPKAAPNYLKKSLAIRKRSKSLAGQAEVYGILGNLAIGESKYDSALFYQLLGLKISLRTPDLIGTAYNLAGVGYTYSKLNNYSKAEHYLNQAESLADSINSGTVMVEILNFRRQIAESKRDLTAYIRYTKAYETLSDSLLRQSESNRVLLSETLAEIQKKNSEILLQKVTLENQEKELSLRRWQIIVVSAGGVLVIIILFILYSGFKASKKLNFKIIEQNNSLATSQEEIQAQNEELLMANEEISAQRDMIQQQRNHLDSRNRQLEDIVEERTKDLVQYIQQLEQFAFISSHNLRAPIARILGLGNLLEMKDLRDSETIHKALIACAHDLDIVIKDLNAVLDIRQNNQLDLTLVMLSDEMLKVRSSLSNQIMANEALIHEDFSEADQVKTFRPYLHSILMNLISNALKYRRLDVSPVITIKSLHKERFVCIQVSDNGMGIDLEKYGDKLFMMYRRFHNHVEGKGLGLYMVKTQIEAMGGKIEIESEINSGTTFYLYFKKEKIESTTAV